MDFYSYFSANYQKLLIMYKKLKKEGVFMFEKVNETKTRVDSWQPCMWCDAPQDTCADIFCVFCDGGKHDFITYD